ncbi:MAG: MFS transporter [Acidimicrobiales bacterium]
MKRPGKLSKLTRMIRTALGALLDQSQPFGRLALVHTLFSAGSTLVTISLAGSLFFSVSATESKSKVLLYLLLTIAPFAVVAPALSPLLDRGVTARRASIAVACGGSALLAVSMADHLKGLLLFPEAFGILVLSKLYLVGKAALVPSMANSGDDLASANAKLAVLAALAGFAISPIGIGLLQLGAPWVLRFDFLVFVAGAVAAGRLPRSRTAPAPLSLGHVGLSEDGRPLAGPPPPSPLAPQAVLPGGPGGLIYGRRSRSSHSGAGGRRSRPDVKAERLRLGLPLFVPEVTVALLAMTVLRGAFGFMTFFLAFGLRAMKAATWWYGAILLASGIGGMAGSMLVPTLRRYLSEQQIIACGLVLTAVAGLIAGFGGTLYVQPLLALVVGCTTTGAKPAFDSIAQRFVPPAALGRAFARFETQLQLAWVVCGLVAVLIAFSLKAGDILIATACGVAAVFHFSLRASLGRHDGADRGGQRRAKAHLRHSGARVAASRSATQR